MHTALKTLVVSVGFMIDAYDLFVIGIVLVMIGTVYENAKTDAAGSSAARTRLFVGVFRPLPCSLQFTQAFP